MINEFNLKKLEKEMKERIQMPEWTDISLMPFEMVRDHIYPFIRESTSSGEEDILFRESIRKEHPHLETMGMDIFFVADMEEIALENYTDFVDHQMADNWKVNKEALYMHAMMNIKKKPVSVTKKNPIIGINADVYAICTKGCVYPNYLSAHILNSSFRKYLYRQLGVYYMFPLLQSETFLMRKKDVPEKDLRKVFLELKTSVCYRPDKLLDNIFLCEEDSFHTVPI